jgi:PRC-barrel domain protein
MRQRWTRYGLLGQEVYDEAGAPVGRVVDTYPFDGGQVEMAVVRLAGAFGGRRLLSLDDAWVDGYGLRTPFAAWQVEDSPALNGGRHGAEDPERARSYWMFEEPAVFARAA